MYRKLMWCYVLVLTLLDISLNSKLTAQGKSHGVTVHESLVEGITFQEWGSAAGGGADAVGGSGRALPVGALRAWPPALSLGRAALGAARAATVTLTNTANATMHLASVAGTTPDFHASFFDSKNSVWLEWSLRYLVVQHDAAVPWLGGGAGVDERGAAAHLAERASVEWTCVCGAQPRPCAAR
ncbi:hypothetical protein MSG28_009432 [Choristoneura fumiferana]|uniref:Uncharacterized protein n=1 Tax=Choristoneura fumiferana TaxID=7141 RepID=A0ACC0KXB6_CHOFU|nr:hypothetical protein MSG28_009432 [Choristoneura fumiferana]